MQRYNSFYQIHKGLRALLYETALHVQRADLQDPIERICVQERIHLLLALFEKHASSEDNFVFAAVKKYEPSVADAFEQEHDRDHALGEKLEAAANALTADAGPAAAAALNTALMEFIVFNLEHMSREEDIINGILWRYYSDEELHGITMQIIANIAPEKLALFNAWMMRGLNNPEIAGWLQQVQALAPAFVYDDLVNTARENIGTERYAAIMGTTAAATVQEKIS